MHNSRSLMQQKNYKTNPIFPQIIYRLRFLFSAAIYEIFQITDKFGNSP